MDKAVILLCAGVAGVITLCGIAFLHPRLWQDHLLLGLIWLSVTLAAAGLAWLIGAIVAAVAERRNKEADRFPRLFAGVQEIIPSLPVAGTDLFAAIVVTVGNSSPKESIIQRFEASAKATDGRDIDVIVACPKVFPVRVFGNQVIRYPEESYILHKTRYNAVRFGDLVPGVVPCIFRGITNINEIDFTTFNVKFTDAVGDKKRQLQWWHSARLTEPNIQGLAPPFMQRPGFPAPEQYKP